MLSIVSPLLFSVIIFIVAVIFLLGVMQSTWMKDLRARYSRKFRRTSTRTIIKPRESNPTAILENRTLPNSENKGSDVYPSDWDYKVSTFSPSSFTTILRNTKQFSKIKTQKAGLDPYYAEPTFVKNQRLKGKEQEKIESPPQRPVSPQKVKQATDWYWTNFLPASQQNINQEATVPTVLPAYVVKQEKKSLFNDDAPATSSTGSSSTKAGFKIPKKPQISDSETADAAGKTESGGGLKLGGGGGLKLGSGGGLKLGSGGGLKLGSGGGLKLGGNK